MVTHKKKDLSRLNNIGDLLCTPDNYFDISSEKDVVIIGGGVWDIEKLSSASNAQNTILWAVGKSVKYPNRIKTIESLNFLDWGVRDKENLKDKSRFLPCVSSLNNEIISKPLGDKTLVFTNANPAVSSSIVKTNKEELYLTNDCSKKEFLFAWEQCNKVITNSYHGIYWGLLSGRQVMPFGYSSKFTNVTDMFGIEFPLHQLYNISKKNKLTELINSSTTTIQLKDCDKWTEEFRKLNFEFAKRLEQKNVICKYKYV